jgi:hypothetical protein
MTLPLRSLGPLVLALATSGCGWTVESARETAAQKTCDYYVRCQQIGTGKAYASRDECVTQNRTSFLSLWPTATCGATLNTANLDLCLKGLDAAACNSGLDILSTLVKCAPANVCAAP